jgi:hypothetical protein
MALEGSKMPVEMVMWEMLQMAGPSSSASQANRTFRKNAGLALILRKFWRES